MSTNLHFILKASSASKSTSNTTKHICLVCGSEFINYRQHNAHQMFCSSEVQTHDESGIQFLESISTTFTQSALAKELKQGNSNNPHTFDVGGPHRSQLHHYPFLAQLSKQRQQHTTSAETFFDNYVEHDIDYDGDTEPDRIITPSITAMLTTPIQLIQYLC
jgi:hypothetical protein